MIMITRSSERIFNPMCYTWSIIYYSACKNRIEQFGVIAIQYSSLWHFLQQYIEKLLQNSSKLNFSFFHASAIWSKFEWLEGALFCIKTYLMTISRIVFRQICSDFSLWWSCAFQTCRGETQMGAQLRTHLKPIELHGSMVTRTLRRALNWTCKHGWGV